jgi:hypothetical protein
MRPTKQYFAKEVISVSEWGTLGIRDDWLVFAYLPGLDPVGWELRQDLKLVDVATCIDSSFTSIFSIKAANSEYDSALLRVSGWNEINWDQASSFAAFFA